MRALPLLCLLLAVGATAQPGYADLDRRVTTLEVTVDRLAGVSAVGTGVYADDLDAERRDLAAAIDAYRADARAYDAEAARVLDEYDRLARYGGTHAERAAYDASRYALEDEARRLGGEAVMLAGWAADLEARFATRAPRAPTARSLELRHRIAQRRIAEQRLLEQHRVAAQRRTATRLSHRERQSHSHRSTHHH